MLSKRMQFFNSSSNYFYTQTLENNYLRQCKTSERQALKNKSNPSLTSKSNKLGKDYTPFNNINNINNKKINRLYFDNIDVESIEGSAYKTYTNFPQLGLDGYNKKTKLNEQIINIEKVKNKKIIEIANKFLNKKIKKLNPTNAVNIYNNYNNSSKNFNSKFITKQISKKK